MHACTCMANIWCGAWKTRGCMHGGYVVDTWNHTCAWLMCVHVRASVPSGRVHLCMVVPVCVRMCVCVAPAWVRCACVCSICKKKRKLPLINDVGSNSLNKTEAHKREKEKKEKEKKRERKKKKRIGKKFKI